MEFYRAYAQPSLPRPDHFRVFGFDVASDVNGEYSKALKEACKAMAGPKPPRPTHCPRCGVANAIFTSNLCYKAGVAGAWNMVCLSCHKVHIPCQPGPTAEALQQIEAIRASDHEAYLERKTKKAKQRAKARAKPQKEDTDDDLTALESVAYPFSNINNAVEVLHTNTLAGAARASGKMKARDVDIKPVVLVAKNYQMKSLKLDGDKQNGDGDRLRTVQLVFWAQDQEPHVEQVPVQFEYELFLYEFTLFKSMRGPCAFERYSFEASLWCDLPWNTSPIHVAPEDDVIFVRSWGVRCRGFGHQLARYQRTHGLSLSSAKGIRATVNIPPARHHWLVVWGAHKATPEIHLVDMSILHDLDEEARLALPWAHLIADAPFLLIWRETETAWAAVASGISSGVLEAPLTLVAHPSAESLVGSGEAIAWLEDWRMGGGPRSRASTPTGREVAPSKRARHRSSSGRVALGRGKRQLEAKTTSSRPTVVEQGRAPPSVKTLDGPPLSPKVFTIANEAEPNTESSSSGHPGLTRALTKPATSASADNIGFADSSPHALLATASVSQDGGVKQASGSGGGVRDAASACIHDATAAAEVNLQIDGPHIPSLFASVTKHIGRKGETLSDAGSAGAHDSSPLDRHPLAPSDSDVEIVEGPHAPSHARVMMDDRVNDHGGPRHDRDAGHASKGSASPACNKDGEILEGLQAPPLVTPMTKDEQLQRAALTSVGGAHTTKSHACTDHDGDVPIVDRLHALPLVAQGSKVDSAASGNIAQMPKRHPSPDDLEVVEVRPPLGRVTKDQWQKSETHSTAGGNVTPKGKRPASPTTDDDIVLIDHPSAELKRSFKKKARSSAPFGPPVDGPGPSSRKRPRRDDSDEVEFVDNASVVPKRRVSEVDGKQFINLT